MLSSLALVSIDALKVYLLDDVLAIQEYKKKNNTAFSKCNHYSEQIQ